MGIRLERYASPPSFPAAVVLVCLLALRPWNALADTLLGPGVITVSSNEVILITSVGWSTESLAEGSSRLKGRLNDTRWEMGAFLIYNLNATQSAAALALLDRLYWK